MTTREALLTVLDAVDYIFGACRPNEAVGAVLTVKTIQVAREALRSSDVKEGAAPELYKALKDAHRYIFTGDGPDKIDRGELATAIEAALGKAKGHRNG